MTHQLLTTKQTIAADPITGKKEYLLTGALARNYYAFKASSPIKFAVIAYEGYCTNYIQTVKFDSDCEVVKESLSVHPALISSVTIGDILAFVAGMHGVPSASLRRKKADGLTIYYQEG